jgi:hypothetical protein
VRNLVQDKLDLVYLFIINLMALSVGDNLWRKECDRKRSFLSFKYEGESVNRSQIEIKRKTCYIRN